MRNKRARWAASVYGRHLPELRCKAEKILKQELGEETLLRWMSGVRVGAEVRVEELDADSAKEWTDGSRIDGRATRVTRRRKGVYLGTMVAAADAEEIL